MDNNPRANDADKYIAGKTTEQVLRALVEAQRNLNETPHPWLVALIERYDRKAVRREARLAA